VARLVGAELQFGIGDDAVSRARMFRSVSIDLQGDAANTVRVFTAHQLHDGVEIDVLVVLAGRGFGGRSKQRFGQPLRQLQSGPKGNAAYRTVGFVVFV